ncbi:Protein WAVE-DAMPENED 2 [Morella rubra]|uniref:Protein WAVE-DAMPENED 2 n=1 Tax=Morella rubra TaxID=262757 RepID=A0A6A1V5V2_9ROSI|nr:Protein WAVE-DAMPENED 2 [Morella rubra]KAB1208199.1 Protein WAVE-DAMPENED 2 [Morella rubra]
MAGEIEESYGLSLQADSLHSGSISFGRFENEPLSWERRSSFSHNRYLEEVEKCSKPGSVIEKKAYFEAHFKKKGLLHQNSSECHNEKEYESSENDVLESREEFAHVNEGSHYAHFNESPRGSEYQGEYEVTAYEMKNPGVSFSAPQMESALNNADVLVYDVTEDVNAEEAHQTETGCDKFLSVNDEPEITLCDNFHLVNDEQEIKVNHTLHGDAVNADKASSTVVNAEPGIGLNQSLECDAVNADESLKSTDPSQKTGLSVKANKTSLEQRRHQYPKLRAAKETAPSKPRVKSQTNLARVQKVISNAASKDHENNPSGQESGCSLRTNTEKDSAKSVIPTTRAIHKTPILEDSRSQKAKLIPDNRRGEKEPRRKKVSESQPSSTKSEPRAHQTANRHNRTVNSTKGDARPGAAGFSFKSDERAERRKEFFVKLEQKMNAKEAEMTQIQAKTQEQIEAEIKQFRRSLNFKATPMPSFYHVDASPGSDGKKVVSGSVKVNKERNKSTSPGSKAAAGSKACLKAGSDQAPSTTESVNRTEPLDALEESNYPTGEQSEGSAIPQTPATNQSCSPDPMALNMAAGRKDREKETDTSLRKHRVPEKHNVTKDKKFEGKQKVGVRRSSNEMARKDMKGIGPGSSSGMGNLAVGVAS